MTNEEIEKKADEMLQRVYYHFADRTKRSDKADHRLFKYFVETLKAAKHDSNK